MNLRPKEIKLEKKQPKKNESPWGWLLPLICVAGMVFFIFGLPMIISSSTIETTLPVAAAQVCPMQSTAVYLYPALNTETDEFFKQTDYQVIYNGQYLGGFNGQKDKIMANLTPGSDFEYIVSASDCLTYHKRTSMHLPCEPTVFITPELFCSEPPDIQIFDAYNNFVGANNITIQIDEADVTPHFYIRYNPPYPEIDYRTYFVCKYDDNVIKLMPTNEPYVPVTSAHVRNTGFILQDGNLIELSITLKNKVSTDLLCFIVDEDYVFEDGEFRLVAATESWQDVGFKDIPVNINLEVSR